MRIAVLDDWQNIASTLTDWSEVRARAELVFFQSPFASEEALAAGLAEFDAVVAMRERSRFPAGIFPRLPRLKLLCFTGARNAAIDIPAATAAGVLVCNNGPAPSSSATAELALALLLACARRIPQGDAALRSGGFQENVPPGRELAGRTLGLLGLGRIGARMARYAQALEMHPIAWSEHLTRERCAECGVEYVSKPELFARADAVSLHLVLSDRTRAIVGAAELAALRPGAILINTSRGPLVDPDALLAALRAGRLVAGLDVYDQEPLPPDHPLRTAPNTVLTPHLGYVSDEAMRAFYRGCAQTLLAWLNAAPINVVAPAGGEKKITIV